MHIQCKVYAAILGIVMVLTRAQYKLSNWLAIFVNIGFIFYCFNRNVQKMWPTKVKFDWPLAKIDITCGGLMMQSLDVVMRIIGGGRFMLLSEVLFCDKYSIFW